MKHSSFLTVFLFLTFMAGLVSCKPKPEEEEQDPQNNAANTEMTVKFGSETAWKAKSVKGNMNNNLLYLFAYPSAVSTDFPCLSMQITPSIGTYEIAEENFNSLLNGNARQYIEYFQETAITLNGISYGDWWVKSGTLSITAFDKQTLTITGTLTLNMFNAKERYIDLSDHYAESSVSIAMNKVCITPIKGLCR